MSNKVFKLEVSKALQKLSSLGWPQQSLKALDLCSLFIMATIFYTFVYRILSSYLIYSNSIFGLRVSKDVLKL